MSNQPYNWEPDLTGSDDASWVHNHDYDPTCREVILDGNLTGFCLLADPGQIFTIHPTTLGQRPAASHELYFPGLKKQPKPPKHPTRADRLRKAAERAQEKLDAELARIEKWGEEPQVGGVVAWVAVSDTRRYDYAAIRAGDGLWYTTGPRSPKGYTWDEFTLWLEQSWDAVEQWQQFR